MTYPLVTEDQPQNTTAQKAAEPGKFTGFGASAEFGAHVFKANIPAGRAGEVVLTEDYGYLTGLEGTPEFEVRAVRVEGYQRGDEIVARVVRDISAAAGRRDGDRFRRAPEQQDKPQPWLTYQQLASR